MTKRINFKQTVLDRASGLALTFLLSFLLPQSAFASSTAIPAAPGSLDPQFMWEDRSQYQTCDQECLVSKSKEILLVEAKYIRKLSDELNVDAAKAARTLGSFCGGTSGTESNAKCLERYTYLLKRRMEVVQGMVAHNSDQLLKLHSQEVEIRAGNSGFHLKGVVNFERFDMNRPSGKEEYAKKSHMYESEQTDDSLRKFGRAYESPEELQAFLEESWREPKLEDYPKIATVARNPEDASGEKIMVIERNSDGSLKYDEDKFNRERTMFLAVRDKLKAEMAAYGTRREAEITKAMSGPSTPDPVAAAKAEERKSFEEAKGVLERTIASRGKPAPGTATSYFIEADKSVFDKDIEALEEKLTTITSSIVRH